MADDALVHGVVKASAAMVLTMQGQYDVISQETSPVLPTMHQHKLRHLAKYAHTYINWLYISAHSYLYALITYFRCRYVSIGI